MTTNNERVAAVATDVVVGVPVPIKVAVVAVDLVVGTPRDGWTVGYLPIGAG